MPVTLHTPPASSLTDAEIARWQPVSVAVAVDLGPDAGQIDPAIRAICPPGHQPRLFGQAVTVHCQPPDFGAVLQVLDVIGPGKVLVIDAGGHRANAMIGDILSGHLRRKGVVGLVVDGAIRDVGTLGKWNDFAVFSRWITARGPTGSNQGAVNLPVRVGGCLVAPGDLIIGDDDGLVALPPAVVRGRIADAEARLAREATWIKKLKAGQTAAEVFGLPAVIAE